MRDLWLTRGRLAFVLAFGGLGIARPGPVVAAPPEMATPQVLNTYPHDPAAFTQGLLLHDGKYYKSTGLYGDSSVRPCGPHHGHRRATD